MRNFVHRLIPCFFVLIFLLSCRKNENPFEPAPNFVTVTVKEGDPGSEEPVSGAEVELSVSETYAGYKIARSRLVKLTDDHGRACFTEDEINKYVIQGESAFLYAWARKRGTYLSNHASGPLRILFDGRINSAHQVVLSNSVTAALTEPEKWMLQRTAVDGQPQKELAECMKDNFVTFSLDRETGRLRMKLNDGDSVCRFPFPQWRDSTIRMHRGDRGMILTGKPLYFKGFITHFETINNAARPDSLVYEQISVQVFHPDSITIYSIMSDYRGGKPRPTGLVHYFYRSE